MSQNRLISLLLALVTLLVFLPVREHEFVNYDDPQYVTENRVVQAGLTVAGVKWAFTTWHAGNWHPLTWLAHLLDCELFALDAGAHHLVNVLLHAANVVLLFLLLKRMTGAHWAAALVAALFAWHPLHVESVAWVAERKDVLSTLFGLLALHSYARFVQEKERRGFWIALLCFALGLMAKPMLVTLPCVLLLLDFWPLRRTPFSLARLAWEKWPFFLLTIVSSVVTFLAQRGGEAVVTMKKFPASARLANALVSYARYLAKLFWPADLAVIYPLPTRVPLWEVAGALGLLVALSLWTWRGRRVRPHLLTGWLWFLGTLVPVIGLVQVGTQAMADRYTYLPAIGVFIMLAWSARDLADRLRLGAWPVAVAAAVMLGGCVVVTSLQLRHWRNSQTLFAHAVAVTGENAVARINLGTALERAGENVAALAHYREALRIDPTRASVHNNLGNVLSEIGRTDEALAHFQKALRLKPGQALVHNNLGVTLAGLGRFDDAMTNYTEAARLQPDEPQAFYLMGLARLRQGRAAEAVGHFRAALRVDPDHPKALTQLARVLATSEDAPRRNGAEAVRLAERATELTGGQNPIVLDTLAMAYAEAGRFSDAVTVAQQANALAVSVGGKDQAAAMERRLAGYRAGQPFRESQTNGVARQH